MDALGVVDEAPLRTQVGDIEGRLRAPGRRP
jgi:hypothetical protein